MLESLPLPLLLLLLLLCVSLLLQVDAGPAAAVFRNYADTVLPLLLLLHTLCCCRWMQGLQQLSISNTLISGTIPASLWTLVKSECLCRCLCHCCCCCCFCLFLLLQVDAGPAAAVH
jgi:hypothetical protein